MSRCPVKTRSTSCNYHRYPSSSRCFVCWWCWFVLLVLPLFPYNSFAVQLESTEEPLAGYGYLYIGDNVGDSSTGNLESSNYKSGGPPEWGIGIGRYYGKVFSVEGIFEYWGERYERKGAVIPGTRNNVIQIGGLGLSAAAIYHFHRKDFHGYAGAGAGYFTTGILITDPDSGLLTDQGAPSDKWLPGIHFTVGLDYRVSANHKLGFEIKHRHLKADFGDYTDGEVDIGGTFLLLMYRHDTR